MRKGLLVFICGLFMWLLAVSFSMPVYAAESSGELQYFNMTLSGGENISFSSSSSGSLLDRVLNNKSLTVFRYCYY